MGSISSVVVSKPFVLGLEAEPYLTRLSLGHVDVVMSGCSIATFAVGEFRPVARGLIIRVSCEATELAVGGRERDRHTFGQTASKDAKQV